MLTFCCSQMFDSSKDYFLIENCKIFLSIIVNYHFCHTRFALIGGHVGHVVYNCHVLFFKMDLRYSIYSLNSRDLFLNLRRLVKMTKPLRFENKSLRLKYKCLICI